jgi:hypothetical protein
MSKYVLNKPVHRSVFYLISSGAATAVYAPYEVTVLDSTTDLGSTPVATTAQPLLAVLVTTPPTAIRHNRFILPYKPSGGIVLGLALVYSETGEVAQHTNITISEISGSYYAYFNDPTPVLGTGIVSYLTYDRL